MASPIDPRASRSPFAQIDGATEGPGLGVIERVLLDNGAGMRAQLLGLGATLMSLDVRSEGGARAPLVLGFDEPARYASRHPSFGVTVGRFANRIAGGRFSLDGETYALDLNEPNAHLHGGAHGFARQRFDAETFADQHVAGVRFTLVSEHGAGGYPGRIDLEVRYTLAQSGVLRIELAAETDRPTVLSLTHHSYFNLRDGGAGDVLDHRLQVESDRVLEIDAQGLPSGRFVETRGTPFDFATPRPIGARIAELSERSGYDHCFVLKRRGPEGTLERAATLSEPTTKRMLEVWTTLPGLQVYSGNFLDGTLRGHGDTPYRKHAGVCLEPQHFPDAPNQPAFPSTRIAPGAPFAHAIEYRFG